MGIEVVLGPTTGGILLAFEVARQLGVRALYAEKENGERTLRRDLTLEAGTRTLIVDDVMTAGGAVRERLDLATRHQALVVECTVLVDRSGGTVDLCLRLESLLTVSAKTWAANERPLCASNIPIEHPGTTVLPKSSVPQVPNGDTDDPVSDVLRYGGEDRGDIEEAGEGSRNRRLLQHAR